MLHPLPCGFNYQTADQLNYGPWKKVWRPEMWHCVWLYILYSSRISMPTMHALRKWWSSMDRFTQSFDFWCVWNTPPNQVFGIFYVKVHIFFLFKIGWCRAWPSMWAYGTNRVYLSIIRDNKWAWCTETQILEIGNLKNIQDVVKVGSKKVSITQLHNLCKIIETGWDLQLRMSSLNPALSDLR